jgi:hypothetical protein
MGSAPGDSTNMSGVVGEESLKQAARSVGGCSTNLGTGARQGGSLSGHCLSGQ